MNLIQKFKKYLHQRDYERSRLKTFVQIMKSVVSQQKTPIDAYWNHKQGGFFSNAQDSDAFEGLLYEIPETRCKFNDRVGTQLFVAKNENFALLLDSKDSAVWTLFGCNS